MLSFDQLAADFEIDHCGAGYSTRMRVKEYLPYYLAVIAVVGCVWRLPIEGVAQQPVWHQFDSQERIAAIAFSAKMDKVAVVFSSDSENGIALFHFSSLRPCGNLGKRTCSFPVQFSDCGRYLVANADFQVAGGAAVWDVQTNTPQKIKLLRQKRKQLDLQFCGLADFRFSSDGKSIHALDSTPNLHWWDWQSSEMARGEIQLTPTSRPRGVFLAKDTFMSFPPERGVGQIWRFDGKAIKKIRDTHPDLWTPFPGSYVTPDGKLAATWNQKARSVDVFDLTKPGTEIVDRMNDHWLPDTMMKEGGAAKSILISPCVVVPDRTLFIVFYVVVEGQLTKLSGIGFFPRTKEKAQELGLNLRTHSHLFLPAPSVSQLVRGAVISPDDRWVVFLGVDLPPRIWSIADIGKAPQAEETIQRR